MLLKLQKKGDFRAHCPNNERDPSSQSQEGHTSDPESFSESFFLLITPVYLLLFVLPHS